MQVSEAPHPGDLKKEGKGGLGRLSVVHFLIALVLLLVTAPFVLESPVGRFIEAVLFTLVFLSAVLAVGGRHRTLILAAVLVTPAVAGTWLNHFQANMWPREWTSVASVAFAAFVIMQLLRFILQAPRVDSQVLCAGISIYLMLGLLWALAYILVDGLVPQAFLFTVGTERNAALAGFDALYFSFSTMTTLGYSDIIPVARVARLLAMLEATTGTLYVTVLIARLVALYSTADPPGSQTTPAAHVPVTRPKERIL